MQEIRRRQTAGQGVQYSMHIYREIRWRLNFTPDVATTRARIPDLRQSLSQPEEQKLAAEQQLPSDGSSGMGIDVWYLKFYYSVEDGLDAPEIKIKYPQVFLDRINSPETLTAKLNSALYDRFTDTGCSIEKNLTQTSLP